MSDDAEYYEDEYYEDEYYDDEYYDEEEGEEEEEEEEEQQEEEEEEEELGDEDTTMNAEITGEHYVESLDYMSDINNSAAPGKVVQQRNLNFGNEQSREINQAVRIELLQRRQDEAVKLRADMASGSKNRSQVLRLYESVMNVQKEKGISFDPYFKKCRKNTTCFNATALKFFDKKRKQRKAIGKEHAVLLKLPKFLTKAGVQANNIAKCRRKPTTTYDYNAVKLHNTFFKDETTFIEASYINGIENRLNFILTQCPLEHTIEDFWEMVYENATEVVFTFIDNTKFVMPKFWPPPKKFLRFREFKVNLVKKHELGAYCIRVVEIIPNNNKLSIRTVLMYNVEDWNDNTKTPSMSYVYEMITTGVEFADTNDSGPIVIACRDGSERSPIFLALVMMQAQLRKYNRMNIFETAKYIRLQKADAFQDLAQYTLLYFIMSKLLGIYPSTSK